MKFTATMLTLVAAFKAASDFTSISKNREILHNCKLKVGFTPDGLPKAKVISTDSGVLLSQTVALTSEAKQTESGEAVFNPAVVAKMLRSIPSKEDDAVTVWTDDSNITFEWGTTVISTRKETDPYPVTEDILNIDDDGIDSITFSLSDMRKVISGLAKLGYTKARVIIPRVNLLDKDLKRMKVTFDANNTAENFCILCPAKNIANEDDFKDHLRDGTVPKPAVDKEKKPEDKKTVEAAKPAEDKTKK